MERGTILHTIGSGHLETDIEAMGPRQEAGQLKSK